MSNKTNKCYARSENEKNCKELVYIQLKVRVFHPNSLRRTWQIWKLCKKHFFKFKESEGLDWYCWYKDGKPNAPVIEYKII